MHQLNINQSMSKIYTIKFTCSNEEFLHKFNEMLYEFYNEYDGNIEFEESK